MGRRNHFLLTSAILNGRDRFISDKMLLIFFKIDFILTFLSLFRIFIGKYDFLDERMADDVFFVEAVDGDAVDVVEDIQGVFEAGGSVAAEVCLGEVAGDDGFGLESKAGEEHFHLFDGGILCFVENDEGAV